MKKIETPVYETDYRELSDLFKEKFGFDPDILSGDNIRNDTFVVWDVPSIPNEDPPVLDEVYGIIDVLEYLCEYKVILPGKYMVEISW